MKKEIADRWIEALRSGEYEQGIKVLRSLDNKFCCLGVLCDILKDELELEWVDTDETLSYYDIGGTVAALPTAIKNLIEAKSEDPKVPIKNGWPSDSYLSTLNDTGCSFEQISNIIEKYWEHI